MDNQVINCIVCGKRLGGRQKRFCSRRCKTLHLNTHHQTYTLQLRRARRKKAMLIAELGGCCRRCGYAKNMAALEFHHTKPELKRFQLDARNLANRKWVEIAQEALQCELLCSNCHAEVHHPDWACALSG